MGTYYIYRSYRGKIDKGGLFAPTSPSSHLSWKGLRNVQKDPSISSFADVSTLFTIMTNFLENQNSEFTEKLFLGAYNSKSYVIQVLGSNCIESNSLYSQKDWFWKNFFLEIEGVRWKGWCGRTHPVMIF